MFWRVRCTSRPSKPCDPLAALIRYGDFLAQERGIGVNPYGIREYRRGDEVRHIHWPSVAKVGEWVVREYEQEKRTRILLNLLVSEQPPRGKAAQGKRETTVSTLTSMLMTFIEQKQEVGLLINGRCVDPMGSGYVDAYLIALAVFDQQESCDVSISYRTLSEHEGAIFGLSELPAAALRGARFDRLVFEDGVPV
ncbi:MAG: DUF58 domain-containing protein [Verrucomicrobia bacterium]|nr:DUF58 domain-containing protein [Verrucomicrobiota bacterium]